MAATLEHRGPDDCDVWVDDSVGVALGHQRLAIIDLSEAGHQPMVSADGRFVITYNGEIYNFRSLRTDLQADGCELRGYSDTEVLLEACALWGIEQTLKRVNGMFAFALWDRKVRFLHLARDRIGEKPLYYGRNGQKFLFASELKAIRASSGFQPRIDKAALGMFLRHNFIPAPYSIYEGIQKLPAGAHFTLALDRAEQLDEPRKYWSLKAVAEKGIRSQNRGGEEDVLQRSRELLYDAIDIRLEADVSLGAFLSGGIDSSLVVALMQSRSSSKVKTFTIGFEERAYNEAEQARSIARYLGTDHTELCVTSAETRDVVPSLPYLYDEPFADSSQIPTYLVSKLASQAVTVSLSGDGGDELFGGYNRYVWGRKLWSTIGWLPVTIRKWLSAGLTQLSPTFLNRALSRGKLLSNFADRRPESIPEMASHTVLSDQRQWAAVEDFTRWMISLDMLCYLPDDILVKVDRATMAVSLESRAPFLDHRLIEWAWQLPTSMMIRNGKGKWLLRKILSEFVPESLFDRPKMGFGIPIDAWLRGPIREWAESLLDQKRLDSEELLDWKEIRRKWCEHQSGTRNWSYYLWSVLMFLAWRERWSV
jgi:asparagine synthase (glutamine-hydrolysing)